MCRIFACQPPETYAFQTRSVRLGGQATSIRLEAAFWRILEEIAELQGTSLPKLLTMLHDEVLEFRGEVPNFASLLRCACLTYMSEGREAIAAQSEPRARPRAGTEFDHPRVAIG
ncbi:ribbon-helix-helix domain-containing protein [Inquilinus limosus]|uniref:ribbon-helix-helix domain-containing protein n=1 Tax=Inquilinus limosus TaxID=171674 RepID=UPI003F17FACD